MVRSNRLSASLDQGPTSPDITYPARSNTVRGSTPRHKLLNSLVSKATASDRYSLAAQPDTPVCLSAFERLASPVGPASVEWVTPPRGMLTA